MSILQLNTTSRSYETLIYFDESCTLSSHFDIPNSVGDEKYRKEDDITFKNQLKRKTEEWLCLQLNKRNRNSGIQPLDAYPKKSQQDRLTDLTFGTQ